MGFVLQSEHHIGNDTTSKNKNKKTLIIDCKKQNDAEKYKSNLPHLLHSLGPWGVLQTHPHIHKPYIKWITTWVHGPAAWRDIDRECWKVLAFESMRNVDLGRARDQPLWKDEMSVLGAKRWMTIRFGDGQGFGRRHNPRRMFHFGGGKLSGKRRSDDLG